MHEIYDGFEDAELKDIWSSRKFEPGAVEIQSEIVRAGRSALKITIHTGDRKEVNEKGKETERDELTESTELWTKEGERCRYAFSIFLPADFPIVPVRLVLAQWKQLDAHDDALVNNPVLALRYVNGELSITLQTGEEKIKLFKTTDEVRGRWLDFEFHTTFSRTEGSVHILLNGKVLCEYIGPTAYSEAYGYPVPGLFYFKMGLYRDKMDEPMSAYFDEYTKKSLME